MTRGMTIVVAGLAVIMIIILGIVFYLVARDVLASNDSVEAPPTEEALTATATAPATSVANLPPPVVEVLPTNTPQPTATTAPTNTPAPTDTPLPTATTVIVPTNPPPPPPPPPPPAATEPPPPPPPPDTRGLTATHFALQDRSVYTVNGQIWFEFQIVNGTGGEVAYNMLGVMPKKDGGDRLDWFQMSYGGPDSTIKPEGMSWEDNIKLPESGNYTLRLAICFDGLAACQSGGGTWATLSQEISVAIN